MKQIKLTTWYVSITWSYDFELLGEADLAGRYYADGVGWFAALSEEDLSIIIITEAKSREMAELIALDLLDQWFRKRDLPGLTDYQTEVDTHAEMMVQVELESIVLAAQKQVIEEEQA